MRSSSAPRPAGWRRCASCCRRCRATLRACRCSSCCTCRATGRACWRTCSRRKCALAGQRGRGQGAGGAGTVYFAPPDYHLLVDAGRSLALSADDLVNLLAALDRCAVRVGGARSIGERLLGVILTRRQRGWRRRAAAVHDAGGITVVQEPQTASPRHDAVGARAAARGPRAGRCESIAQLLQRSVPERAAQDGHDDGRA